MPNQKMSIYDVIKKITKKLGDFANAEINRILDLPEIVDILEKDRGGITVHFYICQESEYLMYEMERWREEADGDELSDAEIHFMDSQILEHVKTNDMLNRNMPARTNTTYLKYKDDEALHIRVISVYVSMDAIQRDMLCNLDRFDDIKAYYKLVVRHELGHVHEMLTFIGQNYDETTAMLEERNKKKKEVMARLDKIEAKTKEDCALVNRIYHEEISSEVVANQYAGFTPEEYELFLTHYGLD